MTTPAELACRLCALGLSIPDLAEIGGVSLRTADYWVKGREGRGVTIPDDVTAALADIEDDLDVFLDHYVSRVTDDGQAVVRVFRDTAELREAHPEIPGRGKAAGPFAGPQMIAALTAQHVLDEDHGVEVDIVYAWWPA